MPRWNAVEGSRTRPPRSRPAARHARRRPRVRNSNNAPSSRKPPVPPPGASSCPVRPARRPCPSEARRRGLGTLDGCKPTALDRPPRRAVREGLGRPARRRPGARPSRQAGRHRGGRDRSRPPPPGSHRHGDETHPTDHVHPHLHSAPGEPPVIGIVGAGAVGTALGVALSRGGWPIHAVASRDAGRRERFRSLVDVTRVFADPEPILDEVELIILAVPDDAVAPLAASLRMYSGQAMIHTSGALGAEVLAPAMAAGTQIGAFHPLVAFADTERAVAALHGATVAIEGDDQLAAMLADMAEAIGRDPGPAGAGLEGRLPRGRRPGRRRLRRPARRDRRAGPGGRPGRGRLARDLRPAHRGDPGQRPGARDPGRADRTDDPRRRRDARVRTSPRCGPTRPASSSSTSPRRGARSSSPRGGARWHRRSRRRCAPRSRRPCNARLNRYHSLPWITASRPSTRPARRRDSSAPRPASGSAGWAFARPVRSTPRASARRCSTARRSRPLARLRAGWRAIHPAVSRRQRSGRPRPLVAMEWARSGRPARPDVRAPRRRRGPPEDLDRHLRRRDRRSIRVGPAVARRRQAPPRTRRPDLDPPRRARRTPGESREETAIREVERRPGSRCGSPARSTRSSTGSSSRARGSTRRSTTS